MVHSSLPARFGVSRIYTKFIVGFVVLTIILVFIIFYFSLSHALIQVTPRSTPVSSDFIANIDTQNAAPPAGTLPGMLFETEVTVEKQFAATGTKNLDGDVIGKVTVYNNLPTPQSLVEKTRLEIEKDVYLRLKNRVDIPANGKVEVEVYADNPSAFESVPPRKFIMPGLNKSLQKEIYAESFATIYSKPGSLKVIKAVDIAKGKEEISDAVNQAAIEKFKAEVNSDYVAVIVARKILEEKVSGEVDQIADNFKISQKVKVTIIGIKKQAIVDLAVERLTQLVSKNMELSNIKAENLTYIVQNYNEEKRTANIKIHAEGDTLLKENSDILNKENLSGLSPKGVELYLKSFDEIQDVKVTLSPFWVKTVPKMVDHITIEIIKPEK